MTDFKFEIGEKAELRIYKEDGEGAETWIKVVIEERKISRKWIIYQGEFKEEKVYIVQDDFGQKYKVREGVLRKLNSDASLSLRTGDIVITGDGTHYRFYPKWDGDNYNCDFTKGVLIDSTGGFMPFSDYDENFSLIEGDEEEHKQYDIIKIYRPRYLQSLVNIDFIKYGDKCSKDGWTLIWEREAEPEEIEIDDDFVFKLAEEYFGEDWINNLIKMKYGDNLLYIDDKAGRVKIKKI